MICVTPTSIVWRPKFWPIPSSNALPSTSQLARLFFAYQPSDGLVETIVLRGADDETLLAISQERRLALNLEEMQAVRAYYEQEERDATDVELEMIAQTWSEHCVHKTFKAIIDYEGPLPGKTERNRAANHRWTVEQLHSRRYRRS